MLMVEFSITPMDKGPHFTDVVARVLKIIDESGLNYQLGPMGTTIEGEWDEVMALIKKCFESEAADSKRITFSLKADWKAGKDIRLKQKVQSVEAKLGRKLS